MRWARLLPNRQAKVGEEAIRALFQPSSHMSVKEKIEHVRRAAIARKRVEKARKKDRRNERRYNQKVIKVPQVSRRFLQPPPNLSPEEKIAYMRHATKTKQRLREARKKRMEA